MKKKNKPGKICLCGRIITDPKNKMGLCPKCQKAGVDIVGTLGLAGIGILLKKNGGKIINGAFNVVRKLK